MKSYIFYFYILSNKYGTLYCGFTNNIVRRVWEHKNEVYKKSFSKRYHCNKLVYFEQAGDAFSALCRERQVKRWSRKKKEFLIWSENPGWLDLAKDWY